MSNELEFVNFCISFGRRLNAILEEKIVNSKKFENLTEEDEYVLKLLIYGKEIMGMEFDNENRNFRTLKEK